jgi:hypothetical protein
MGLRPEASEIILSKQSIISSPISLSRSVKVWALDEATV